MVHGEKAWNAPIFSNEEFPRSTPNTMSSSVVSSGTIKIGQLFENKGDLKLKLHMYAMKNNFEFKVKKSGNKIWYISCIDYNCPWRLQTTNFDKFEMFEVRSYVSEHSHKLREKKKHN